MTIGKRIAAIRTLRGMTQAELGLKLEFTATSAGTRVAQYETGYRVPKEEMAERISEILDVSPYNFYTFDGISEIPLIVDFFWMEEFYPDRFCLFSIHSDKKAASSSQDALKAYYNASGISIPNGTHGVFIGIGDMESYLSEWMSMKERLSAGDISKKDYFEWKLQFPYSSHFYQEAHGMEVDDEDNFFKDPPKWRKSNK